MSVSADNCIVNSFTASVLLCFIITIKKIAALQEHFLFCFNRCQTDERSDLDYGMPRTQVWKKLGF